MPRFVYLAIGAITGCCGFFIAIGVETLLEIRFGTMLKLMDEHSIFAAWLVDVTLAMAFVGVATGLVVWVEPASSGSGIPDLKAYLNGTNLRRLLTLKAAVCKVIGVLFSVGGGLCVGKEGPVRSGAALRDARARAPVCVCVCVCVFSRLSWRAVCVADGAHGGSCCCKFEPWLAQLWCQALEVFSQRHRQT